MPDWGAQVRIVEGEGDIDAALSQMEHARVARPVGAREGSTDPPYCDVNEWLFEVYHGRSDAPCIESIFDEWWDLGSLMNSSYAYSTLPAIEDFLRPRLSIVNKPYWQPVLVKAWEELLTAKKVQNRLRGSTVSPSSFYYQETVRDLQIREAESRLAEFVKALGTKKFR